MAPQMPEGIFPVTMQGPRTTNGGFNSGCVSLKNAQMAWVVVSLQQAVGHATLFSIEKATNVAAAGATAITATVPIWYGEVSSSADALTRQANAVNFTMGGSVTGAVRLIFQIDPSTLGSNFDVIRFVSANSGQANNLIDVTCWLWPKFGSKTGDQLSFVTD